VGKFLNIRAKDAQKVFYSNKMAKIGCTGFLPVLGHHYRFILYVNGKKTHIKTRFSHGARAKVHKQSLNQLSIDENFFRGIIDCLKSLEDYIKILVRKKVIEAPRPCNP